MADQKQMNKESKAGNESLAGGDKKCNCGWSWSARKAQMMAKE